MNKILLKMSIVSILLFGLSSCKNFLDVTPVSSISSNTAWRSTTNADLFLNGIYNNIPDPTNTSDTQENMSDNSMSGIAMVGSRNLYNLGAYTPDFTDSRWGHYNAIRKCNLFIDNVSSSDLDASWKKKRIAEARFIRAYFYQLLWTVYGGVPIITDVLDANTQGDGIYRKRNTDEETFQFIINECEAIVEDLPSRNATETGRITKGAALALKGWCELFHASPLKNPSNDQSKWASAAATYKKLMDLQEYTLFPDYETLFYDQNNFNSEIIFAKGHAGGTPLGSSVEYSQSVAYVNNILSSSGGVNPTQELVDEYAMANGLPISDSNSGYDPQNPYLNREPRFYKSIIYDGSLWLGAPIVMKQGVGSRNATDFADKDEATNTGYYVRKAMDQKYAKHVSNLSSANYILYRYAEILVSYAEAQNEALNSPDNSVYDALNAIRARAGIPVLAAGLTKDQMRTAIYRERRVELAFEEKRWYDLLRLKLAETKINTALHAIKIENVGGTSVYTVVTAVGGNRVFDATKNYLWPIPQSVIDQNKPGNIPQNPGY